MIIIVEALNNAFNETHPSQTAWNNSRPNNSPIDLKDILALDLPVNEIPVATLFIESTIIEREILVTLRNHVMWAQTSRVQNILEFTYPKRLSDLDKQHLERVREEMQIEHDRGIRQDSYRRHLPIMSNTKYTVNLSMRDMIHLYKYFKSLYNNEYMTHLSPITGGAMIELGRVLTDAFGVTETEISWYKDRHILKSIQNKDSGRVGDVMVINTKISIGLRAQLARHRALIIQDDLYRLMKNESIMREDNELLVDVQISGLVQDWIEIIRKRSCWIAQYDLWKDLLDKAEDILQLGRSSLPCHAGFCPYNGDAMARYTDDDPNAPCPIHAKINDKIVTKDQFSQINSQHIADKRPEFWLKEMISMRTE